MVVSDHEIDIRPGVGAIEAYRYMDTNEWYALAELVDNSIASWERNRKFLVDPKTGESELTISIRFDPTDNGRLKVWDNAAGINSADFQRAFKPGSAPDDKTSLSRYGLGMKMASIWFADNWKVTTTAFNEEVTRTVEFDVPEIIRENRERVATVEKPRGSVDHGTEVELWNLRRTPQGSTVGKMKSYLTQMYRGFIRAGHVEILWNGEPLVYEPPVVLVAPHHETGTKGDPVQWTKTFEITIEGSNPVRGRAILFAKGKGADAGLNLFWRGRLIKGNLEPQYKPPALFPRQSFISQRLLVDVHLDDFQPTFDKKDFAWNSCPISEDELLKLIKAALKEQPLDFLDQAENYRATELDGASRDAARQAVSSTVETVQRKGAKTIEAQVNATPIEHDPLPEPQREKFAHTESIVLTISGQIWRIMVNLSDRAQDRSDWLDITDMPGKPGSDGSRRLGVRVSMSNPFTLRYGTNRNAMDILIRFAAGLAIAEITAREAGDQSPGAIRRNLNTLLLEVLADK